MEKKYEGPHAKRGKLLIGWTNEYLAAAQLLTEAYQDICIGQDENASMQDAIRWAVFEGAFKLGVAPSVIAARAAELDKQDKEKAGQA